MIATVRIDWGTTNARAWACAADGSVVERRHAALGIRNVGAAGFRAAFDHLVEGWPVTAVPVVMSGMVGSRQGWQEAPYAGCPASLDSLAAALIRLPEPETILIVPGVGRGGAGERHDVMRGEEVQCFGALAREDRADGLICLPGTHSKWVRMAEGRIVDFASAMTGEVFEVMSRHSILGALMAEAVPGHDGGAAFRRGLDRAGEAGGLLNHLFSARADALFGEIAADEIRDYLSGVLIGHEIREMPRLLGGSGEILVIADGPLPGRYRTAFAHLAIPARLLDAEAVTVAGLGLVLDHAGR
ncbi:2-keto-3-deoxygalactonate kinase [Tepidamorphus gemmatus]|uniref:2-keto-3-deoxygalactonate kinase n=1 Tax=Tepidamorphus gemmatus TaxID=747076 RepID=A0A4R3MAF6_9HYPH|nr:2-dehydro-3-deoxygalactonokinase [Tepidamorphus gemmatus]TCT10574.1 2-keto-3-deoxygalactonate kinase [Tepidamorphus gemmatus]